jgi:predicted transcriptional regulator
MRYSRRTARASCILDTLSIELTGKLGSLLSKQLLLPVSTSTVTRIAMKQKLPEIIQPIVLGVDDWAFRKGVNYGTILIDMETSRPIDLLASRESSDLKGWLKKYPNVKIVTRDRASSYSSAINEVCPDAIQVADRFHLLMNLSDALDIYFKSVQPGIKLLIKNKTEEIIKMSASGKLPEDKEDSDSASIAATPEFEPINTDQRIDTFNKVKELQAEGISARRISKVVGISRNTVRSYILQESLSPRNSSRSTNIASFTKLILVRLNTKGYKIKDIIDEILLLGFDGGRTQAYSNINTLKLECKINIPSFTEIQQNTILFHCCPVKEIEPS